MADRLTQLQDCYDQLATQFYASLRYISLHHSSSALDPPPTSQTNSQPTANNDNNDNNDTNTTTVNNQSPPPQPTQSQDQPTQSTQPQPSQDQPDNSSWPPEQRPDSPNTFAAAQHELAHDLILKTKQIEYLVSVLPGVENSQERQEERIRELDGELREALVERRRVEDERKRVVRRVEGVITAVRT